MANFGEETGNLGAQEKPSPWSGRKPDRSITEAFRRAIEQGLDYEPDPNPTWFKKLDERIADANKAVEGGPSVFEKRLALLDKYLDNFHKLKKRELEAEERAGSSNLLTARGQS